MIEEIIGYWNNSNNQYPECPMPVERKKFDNNEDVEKLKKIFEKSHPRYCKGSSICRCCGKMNGSVEYVYQTKKVKYIIPEGYLHYVQDHYVELDYKLKNI